MPALGGIRAHEVHVQGYETTGAANSGDYAPSADQWWSITAKDDGDLHFKYRTDDNDETRKGVDAFTIKAMSNGTTLNSDVFQFNRKVVMTSDASYVNTTAGSGVVLDVHGDVKVGKVSSGIAHLDTADAAGILTMGDDGNGNQKMLVSLDDGSGGFKYYALEYAGA